MRGRTGESCCSRTPLPCARFDALEAYVEKSCFLGANDRQRRKARRRHDNFVFVHPKAAMSGDYVGCSVVHKDYHVCSSILARQRQGKRGGGCRRTPLARRRHCSVQANNDANESVRSQ